MDAELYAEAIQYELLTQAIYQAILSEEGHDTIQVEHNIDLPGRSGVSHQIDVLWKFKQAGLEHTVIIECKNYSSAITLEKVRNLFAVAHDIGNCRPIMVTKTGYQQGAADFATYYGIALKLLRKPTEKDWDGRIKDIILRMTAKMLVSTEEQGVQVAMYLNPDSDEQQSRLDQHISAGTLRAPSGPDVVFLDKDSVPVTEEMRWWLPKQIDVLDKEPGGPYTQTIPLEDKYILVQLGDHNEELVKVGGLNVTFYVEEKELPEIALYGEQTVKTILKDFSSGDIEHIVKHP